MTRSNKKRDSECYNPFSQGDEVFVTQVQRRWRGDVIMTGKEFGANDAFVVVEDCDERHITVHMDHVELVCEGFDGYGTLVYPARQAYSESRGTYIEDETEETCRMCKGTGVPVCEDEYSPEE